MPYRQDAPGLEYLTTDQLRPGYLIWSYKHNGPAPYGYPVLPSAGMWSPAWPGSQASASHAPGGCGRSAAESTTSLTVSGCRPTPAGSCRRHRTTALTTAPMGRGGDGGQPGNDRLDRVRMSPGCHRQALPAPSSRMLTRGVCPGHNGCAATDSNPETAVSVPAAWCRESVEQQVRTLPQCQEISSRAVKRCHVCDQSCDHG
jgi:hypothetical protein